MSTDTKEVRKTRGRPPKKPEELKVSITCRFSQSMANYISKNSQPAKPHAKTEVIERLMELGLESIKGDSQKLWK